MKEHILKYLELNPKLGYYDLVKIFGIPIINLLKLLNINHYEIKGNNLEIYISTIILRLKSSIKKILLVDGLNMNITTMVI